MSQCDINFDECHNVTQPLMNITRKKFMVGLASLDRYVRIISLDDVNFVERVKAT